MKTNEEIYRNVLGVWFIQLEVILCSASVANFLKSQAYFSQRMVDFICGSMLICRFLNVEDNEQMNKVCCC